MSLLLRWLLDADEPVQLCQAPSGRRYVSCRTGSGAAAHHQRRLYLLAKRVLLRRKFFVNDDKTTYVSVGYYPARDYQILVEFGSIRKGGSKCLILADERVAALADCLPSIRDSMCVGGDRVVIKCESGNFRLHTPRRHGSARLFVGTEEISLTQPDMDYLLRVFHIIQQQLRY